MIVQCGKKNQRCFLHWRHYDHRTIDDESDPLFAYRDDLEQDRFLVVGVYVITQPIESKQKPDTAIIDQPVLQVVRQQCLMNRLIRPLEWEIVISKTPINDPNHLRNL